LTRGFLEGRAVSRVFWFLKKWEGFGAANPRERGGAGGGKEKPGPPRVGVPRSKFFGNCDEKT